jgi:two-component system, chemotaxis family, sensor kinase CheA
MLKDWKQFRMLFTTVFFVFLVVAFLLLAALSRLSIPAGPDRNRLFLLLLALSFVAFVLFILGFLSLNSRSQQSVKKEDVPVELKSASGNDSQQALSKKQNKQGRLVKKMRWLLADLETGSPERLGDTCLASLAREYQIVQGLFYIRENGSDLFKANGRYAWYSIDPPADFRLGDSLNGQAARDGKLVHIPNVPENYIQVLSGLGDSSPNHLYIIPLMKDGRSVGLIELATFVELDHFSIQVIQALTEHIAGTLGELFVKN